MNICCSQAEIDRLQSELDNASHQQSISGHSRQTGNDDEDDVPKTQDSSSGTETQWLIDRLQSQLRQTAVSQQATNMQLDAVKQVLLFHSAACCLSVSLLIGTRKVTCWSIFG